MDPLPKSFLIQHSQLCKNGQNSTQGVPNMGITGPFHIVELGQFFAEHCTLICICIHTPVKRQYINTFFETTKNDRKRVATDFNFLSFIYIDVKGFSFKFGKKYSLASKCQTIKVILLLFSIILHNKRTKKRDASTFKIQHFKASEDFLTKFQWGPLDININE